jgi:triacylglycerol esterase/lipase EstA (alpha/beta hydrolase family)
MDYDYPILALTQWDAAGKVYFDNDEARIVQRVAAARRVVVLVHGIIGDTFGMGARLAPGADDVFLTFDYENLNTSIEQTSAGLKQRLAAAGLNEGHSKNLVVIAHSMGGLVSRWFIERLVGYKIVSRLILCGTPNAGSPWSTAEDWATAMWLRISPILA